MDRRLYTAINDGVSARAGPFCAVEPLFPMRAGFGVDALIGQAQPLNWLAANQVFFYDLRCIFRLNVPVPDRLWIHHHGWPVLALVKAS